MIISMLIIHVLLFYTQVKHTKSTKTIKASFFCWFNYFLKTTIGVPVCADLANFPGTQSKGTLPVVQ